MALKARFEQNMTKHPYIANKKMTIVEATRFMDDCGIRHLPVTENEKLIGVVSDRDLKKAQAFAGPGTLLVEDVMTYNPFCVKKGASLAQVARSMAEQRIGSAIVKDENDQVVGIFTTTDGMRLLSEILKKEGAGRNQPHEIGYDTFPEYMSW